MIEATMGRKSRKAAAAVAIAAALAAAMPTAVTAQAATGWSFGTDPFAELWYHGLAMVGFEGFGRVPLYDAEYAWAVRSARRAGRGIASG